MDWIKRVLVLLMILFILNAPVSGVESKRTPRFRRTIAMGGAFTAAGIGVETVAFNPAGLLQPGVKWSLYFNPIFPLWFSYNEIVRQIIRGDLDVDTSSQASLRELPGTRLFFEFQIPILPLPSIGPLMFFPDSGLFLGSFSHNWIEFVFPAQTIIPMFHIEAISHNQIEVGMAFELFDSGLYFGTNFKMVKRLGIIADISLLRIANLTLNDLEEEYNPNPPPLKMVFDVGFLYQFDHKWKPRFGVSSIDALSIDLGDERTVGYDGVDYGSAGSTKTLNTFGFALTQKFGKLELLYCADYQDFTYTYFNNNSVTRRIALGFEASFDKKNDNTNTAAVQIGLRELKHLSLGFNITMFAIHYSFAQWTENFGTEKNPKLDKRYMYQISLNF